jgi:hypothetical protein
MLMAHFDILITDDDFKPKFAIEFDGLFHSVQRQRERDSLKDEICHKALLPLVRIREDDFSHIEALARNLKHIDRGVESEIAVLEILMCLSLATRLLSAIYKDKWRMFKQEVYTYAQRFYDLRYLGVSEEDSYYNWHYPRTGFPPGSAAYRRCWLLSTLIAFWDSSRKNLGPLTEEDLTEVFNNLLKCAKLIEAGLTSISFNDLSDVPVTLEDNLEVDPERRRNLVNQILKEHPHPFDPS